MTSIAAQRLVDLENDCIAPTDTTDDRYNLDNKIYQSNKEFIFDYTIFKDKDSLLCHFKETFVYSIPSWQLVSKAKDRDPRTIHYIGFAISPNRENDNQTGLHFKYYNQSKTAIAGIERTGLVENAKNIWRCILQEVSFLPLPNLIRSHSLNNLIKLGTHGSRV
jgi:hypothetical protein